MSQGLTEQVGHTDPEGMMLAQWFSHLGEMGGGLQAHLTPAVSQRVTVRPCSFPFYEELEFPLARSQAPHSSLVLVFSHAN